MALSRGSLSLLLPRCLRPGPGGAALPPASGCHCLSVSAAAARRKTRWMPTAPSKVYRVPKRPEVPDDEREEMKKLYNTYRTAMKSLNGYFRADWQRRQSSRAQPGHVLSPEEEEAEHRQLMELNRAENERMAAERENRLMEKAEAIRRRVERLQQEAAERQRRDHQTAVELVRTQEEISRLYIPREKLAEAIEDAINNETDYNYAMDKSGRRWEGRLTRPS